MHQPANQYSVFHLQQATQPCTHDGRPWCQTWLGSLAQNWTPSEDIKSVNSTPVDLTNWRKRQVAVSVIMTGLSVHQNYPVFPRHISFHTNNLRVLFFHHQCYLPCLVFQMTNVKYLAFFALVVPLCSVNMASLLFAGLTVSKRPREHGLAANANFWSKTQPLYINIQ